MPTPAFDVPERNFFSTMTPSTPQTASRGASSARVFALTPLHNAFEAPSFGGKAAQLAWLAQHGASIPRGWAIPRTWLDHHLVHAGLASVVREIDQALLGPDPDSTHALERAAYLRQRIESIELMPAAREALRQVPVSTTGAWVVRSSALGEDSREASFAGQLESYLHLDSAAAIEKALRQVWASAWSEHCLSYQMHTGRRLSGVGVVLCEQVRARYAGVLFTQMEAPSNELALAVEYCAGLADGLVGGSVDPARAWLDRSTLRLLEHRGPQEPAFELLDESQLQALARQSLALEQHAGTALDIEWCLSDSGQPVFVQARPVTTAVQEREIWTNANIAENFPGVICPLLESFVGKGYAAYFRGLARTIGLSEARIQAMDDDLNRLVATHGGRLYYNLSSLHRVLANAPCGALLKRYFNVFVGADRIEQRDRTGHIGWTDRFAEAVRMPIASVRAFSQVQQRVGRFEANVDAFCEHWSIPRIKEMSAQDLALGLEGFLSVRLGKWSDASLADACALITYGALGALSRRWFSRRATESIHNTLLKGLRELPSNLPVTQLWALAQQVLNGPQHVRELIENTPADQLTPALEGTAEGRQFLGALMDYLERWGFRSSGELMLTVPMPHEDLTSTITLLKRYMHTEGQSPLERLEAQSAQRETLEDELFQELSGRGALGGVRARLFALLVKAAQGSIALRERARFRQAKLYTRLRAIVLGAGQCLVGQGVLRDQDDAFMFTIDELVALLRETSPLLQAPGAPQQIADTRRARCRQDEARDVAADTFELARGKQLRLDALLGRTQPAAVNANGVWHGTAACSGVYEGPAIVLHDASEVHRMKQGDVLVTRQTDPGWAPAFFLARGLVVERGGMLSHGAIVAREFGIPAVVGIPGITQQLEQGDCLHVDGSQGVVRRVVSR